jgi:glutamate synthase (NADPH/NADH) large chain
MVKTMMIPRPLMSAVISELAKLYAYCNSVMEPWDGPAAIAAYANNWVIAGLDRNGLRPDALCGHH